MTHHSIIFLNVNSVDKHKNRNRNLLFKQWLNRKNLNSKRNLAQFISIRAAVDLTKRFMLLLLCSLLFYFEHSVCAKFNRVQPPNERSRINDITNQEVRQVWQIRKQRMSECIQEKKCFSCSVSQSKET